jgi:hypothetical protein
MLLFMSIKVSFVVIDHMFLWEARKNFVCVTLEGRIMGIGEVVGTFVGLYLELQEEMC